jgi:hypothetical protein
MAEGALGAWMVARVVVAAVMVAGVVGVEVMGAVGVVAALVAALGLMVVRGAWAKPSWAGGLAG